jgi:2-oxoglutarate ferredoxin oxidoreductase subunit alpha
MYEITYESFDIAEKYRNPVMLLCDGIVGQMMEPVDFNKEQKTSFAKKECVWTAVKEENRDQ